MSAAEVITDQLPVRKDSLEELVGHRNRALELARQGIVLLAEAEAAARRAAPMDSHAGFLHELCQHHSYSLRYLITGDSDEPNRRHMDEAMATVTQRVDMHAWTSLQSLSGLRNLMDAKATEEFRKQVSEKPPAFVMDNITATYMALAADAPNIFERGLVNVFRELNVRDYKTNSAFRVGKRVILNSLLGPYGWNSYRYGRQKIADLDRVFHVLDGKKPPETANAADAMEHAYRREHAREFDSTYFSARLFHGNGNVHLTFKRLDLVDKANNIIARQLGATLPDERRAA